MTDPAAVDDCVGAVHGGLGRIDVLVNNAGVIDTEVPLLETDPEQWWRTVEVNVRGPFLMSRAVHPAHGRGGGGRMVNLTSGAGLPERRPHGLQRQQVGPLAAHRRLHEAGRVHGVRAFDLAPGVVRTDMTESMRMHVGRTEWTAAAAGDRPAAGPLLGRARRLVRSLGPRGHRHPRLAAGQAARGVGPDDRALRLHPWGPDDPLA